GRREQAAGGVGRSFFGGRKRKRPKSEACLRGPTLSKALGLRGPRKHGTRHEAYVGDRSHAGDSREPLAASVARVGAAGSLPRVAAHRAASGTIAPDPRPTDGRSPSRPPTTCVCGVL